MSEYSKPKNEYNCGIHPQIVCRLFEKGYTETQIADELGISAATLKIWKKQHPEFADSLRGGTDVVDALVEGAVLKRALGYDYEELVFDRKDDAVWVKKTQKHIPPDVSAATFWLKNRRPEHWGDKRGNETQLAEFLEAVRSGDEEEMVG